MEGAVELFRERSFVGDIGKSLNHIRWFLELVMFGREDHGWQNMEQPSRRGVALWASGVTERQKYRDL